MSRSPTNTDSPTNTLAYGRGLSFKKFIFFYSQNEANALACRLNLRGLPFIFFSSSHDKKTHSSVEQQTRGGCGGAGGARWTIDTCLSTQIRQAFPVQHDHNRSLMEAFTCMFDHVVHRQPSALPPLSCLARTSSSSLAAPCLGCRAIVGARLKWRQEQKREELCGEACTQFQHEVQTQFHPKDCLTDSILIQNTIYRMLLIGFLLSPRLHRPTRYILTLGWRKRHSNSAPSPSSDRARLERDP